MQTFWAFWSLVCCLVTANGARNRYQYSGWRDFWFLFYVAIAAYNAAATYFFLVN